MHFPTLAPFLLTALLTITLAADPYLTPTTFTCNKQTSRNCTLSGVFSWEGTNSPSSTLSLYDEACSQVGQMVTPAKRPFDFYSKPGELQDVVVDTVIYPKDNNPGHLKFQYGATTVETDIMNVRNDYWNSRGKARNCDCWRSGEKGCNNDTCCVCMFDCSWRG